MKITAEPRSDQWNAIDFIGGPRTFTVAGVKPGTAEQKYDIDLVEGEGRSWRPPLTVLRILIAAWGDEAKEWAGHRVTLYRDETIRFGPDAVGGVRIKALSHIKKPLLVVLPESRGKSKQHRVDPLPDEPAPQPADPFARMLSAFADLGVTEQQVTSKLGKPRAEWGDAEMDALKALGGAIKRGEQTVADAFPSEPPVTEDQLVDLAIERERMFGKTAASDQKWRAWVDETTNRTVPADTALTEHEAGNLLALAGEK